METPKGEEDAVILTFKSQVCIMMSLFLDEENKKWIIFNTTCNVTVLAVYD